MTSVLIVDDDEELRTAILRTLCARGYDVQGASDVEQAVDILSSCPIEVLVTDLRMSGRDGIDLISELRHVSPSTRPILMSAFASARDHQTATDYGAVAVLCKPFEPQALFAAIDQAAECDTGFRGSVHGLSLVDLLQMFHYARRSITLTLPGIEDGKIYIDEGELIHAELGELSGVEALRALLGQPSGSLRTGVLQPVERTLPGSFDSVLLDALRALDESAARTSDPAEAFCAWSEPPPAGEPSAELDRVRQRLESLVAPVLPDASLWIAHPTDGPVLAPEDDEGAEDPGAGIRGMAASAAALTPTWCCIERMSDRFGMGLLRLEDPPCLALILAPLNAHRGKERFRSQLWALADRIGRER